MGDGAAVSEAGKMVLYFGKLMPGTSIVCMWVGNVLRNNSVRDNGRRGQRTKHVFIWTFCLQKINATQPLERVPCCCNMHWGVACTTARADDVYAMMMGSLTDDQMRHSPIRRRGNLSVSIKTWR